jgi:hypothetical protein
MAGILMATMILAIAATALLCMTQATSQLALINGRIYTVNEANPWAEALLIDNDGMIVQVGATDAIMTYNVTKMVDLKQRLVLPGFQDAHLHVVEAGINAQLCYIDEDAFVAELPFYFQDCPNGGEFGNQGWIVGAGIDVGILLEDTTQEYPITVLDEAYPTTPVLILDSLGHGAVANSAAMAAVGYNVIEGDPPGGILIRDEFTNELTGIVLENAQQPLRDAAFPPTVENQQLAYESLLDALETLAQNGITTVSDAGGFYRQAQTEAWARVELEGVLTVRASNALYVYPDTGLDEQLRELTSRHSNDPNSLVRFNQAKIYVDGILSLLTGALYEPYSLALPEQDAYGFEYFGEALQNVSETLSNAGFQLHFHVTGDRGAGLALDAIERLSNNATAPHRLTHLYLVNETDWTRFAQLGVVADFQLAPSSVDTSYTEFMKNLIGETRASQLLPALELYNAGALLTLSSDWDADVLSPIRKIQTVLTRPDGRSFPNVESVIPLLTINPAVLLQHDDKTGSIEVGKSADLVVLDKNIFELQVDEIHTAQVILTMFQGEVIYDPEGIMGEEIGNVPVPTSAGATLCGNWRRNFLLQALSLCILQSLATL